MITPLKAFSFLATLVVSATLSCPNAHADLMNGNFEATPFDTDWDNSDGNATLGAGFAPGSTQSASFAGVGTAAATDDFFQDTTSDASVGTLTWWLQTDTVASADRGFNMVLGTTAGTSGINLRVNGSGTLEAFDAGWNALSGVGDFAASSIYYFELDFVGLGTGDVADVGYTLNWSNANPGSATTSNTSGAVAFVQNDGHVSGGTLNRIQLASRSNWDNYSVDDFTLTAVPEPSSLALIAMAGFGVCLRRRK